MTQMGEMQQQVYQVHDVNELKQRLIDVWHGFEQSVINVWKCENLNKINYVNIKQELLRYVQHNFTSFGLLRFVGHNNHPPTTVH